jgi:hypothetical protein
MFVKIVSSHRHSVSWPRHDLAVNNHTTIAVDDLPTNLTAVCASQENDHRCDLTGLSTTTNGSAESLLRLFSHGRNDQRCPDGTWSNCVDTNALAHPLVAETVCESGDGTLGARVVEQVWTADVGVDTGVVDDGVALGHMRKSVFREVEESYAKLSVLITIAETAI